MPPLSMRDVAVDLDSSDETRAGPGGETIGPVLRALSEVRLEVVAATKGPIRVHYLTVDEIESGLVDLSTRHPSLCRMVTLPHRTFEGRTVTALRIGRPDDGGVRAGCCFLAGVHAHGVGRFRHCTRLRRRPAGLLRRGDRSRVRRQTFGAGDIASVIDNVDVFVLACVNPDGRAYSQQSEQQKEWRKNRSRLSDTDNRIGTDLNRNFDFLWTSRRRSTRRCATSRPWAASRRRAITTSGAPRRRRPRP
jgi:murein tripeptide amidase MpaA